MQNAPFKIGIDARLYNEAGPGRYIKNILHELEKQDTTNIYYVFLTDKEFDAYQPSSPRFKKVRANYPWYSWQEQLIFPWTLYSYKLDLLYVPHFNIPVLYAKKIVTAIPDLIMHTYSTAGTSTHRSLYFSLKKAMYYFVFSLAMMRSNYIIVPSHATENDMKKAYPRVKDVKYVVAYEGFEYPEVKNTSSANRYKKEYMLYIGSAYPHKNLYRLVEGFQILRERYAFDGLLIIAGKKDANSLALHQYIKKVGLEKHILMPGLEKHITDESMAVLLSHALFYIQPSLKEGFSLTPLEALAWDLPITISDIECHKEIYGDIPLYFDPNDAFDMAEKMYILSSQSKARNEVARKGKSLLKKYTWRKTADLTMDTFYKALRTKS